MNHYERKTLSWDGEKVGATVVTFSGPGLIPSKADVLLIETTTGLYVKGPGRRARYFPNGPSDD